MGCSRSIPKGVTAALFRQHTSRTANPQLHTHALIAYKVQDTTGRRLWLDARFLMYRKRSTGWDYDAALRTELANRLGAAWTSRDGGVPWGPSMIGFAIWTVPSMA